MCKGDASGPEVTTTTTTLYKIVRGMVPAINAVEVFVPIRSKRQSRAKKKKKKKKKQKHQDCYTSNFVNRYIQNNSECYKVPESKTDQFRIFLKTTSDWNCFSDDHIRAETVNSF